MIPHIPPEKTPIIQEFLEGYGYAALLDRMIYLAEVHSVTPEDMRTGKDRNKWGKITATLYRAQRIIKGLEGFK